MTNGDSLRKQRPAGLVRAGFGGVNEREYKDRLTRTVWSPRDSLRTTNNSVYRRKHVLSGINGKEPDVHSKDDWFTGVRTGLYEIGITSAFYDNDYK